MPLGHKERGKKRKPTQAANTGSSTSWELPRVACKSSNAFAFVMSSFLDRFLNNTTRLPSDTCERSGGSVTYDSCEAAGEEKALGEPNPPKLKGEGAPKAVTLLLRAGVRFLDICTAVIKF